jgi:hypothetical protein
MAGRRRTSRSPHSLPFCSSEPCRPGCPEGAQPGVSFLLVTFSLDKQGKVTRAPQALESSGLLLMLSWSQSLLQMQMQVLVQSTAGARSRCIPARPQAGLS